jgi:hypothetical protein
MLFLEETCPILKVCNNKNEGLIVITHGYHKSNKFMVAAPAAPAAVN